jgi:hypothetical protein
MNGEAGSALVEHALIPKTVDRSGLFPLAANFSPGDSAGSTSRALTLHP